MLQIILPLHRDSALFDSDVKDKEDLAELKLITGAGADLD